MTNEELETLRKVIIHDYEAFEIIFYQQYVIAHTNVLLSEKSKREKRTIRRKIDRWYRKYMRMGANLKRSKLIILAERKAERGRKQNDKK